MEVEPISSQNSPFPPSFHSTVDHQWLMGDFPSSRWMDWRQQRKGEEGIASKWAHGRDLKLDRKEGVEGRCAAKLLFGNVGRGGHWRRNGGSSSILHPTKILRPNHFLFHLFLSRKLPPIVRCVLRLSAKMRNWRELVAHKIAHREYPSKIFQSLSSLPSHFFPQIFIPLFFFSSSISAPIFCSIFPSSSWKIGDSRATMGNKKWTERRNRWRGRDGFHCCDGRPTIGQTKKRRPLQFYSMDLEKNGQWTFDGGEEKKDNNAWNIVRKWMIKE